MLKSSFHLCHVVGVASLLAAVAPSDVEIFARQFKQFRETDGRHPRLGGRCSPPPPCLGL